MSRRATSLPALAFRHAALLALALHLCLLSPCAPAQPPAVPHPPPALPTEPERFNSLLLPRLREAWTAQLHSEIAALSQSLSLSEAIRTRLTDALPEALETHLRSLPRTWPESLRDALENDPSLLSGDLQNAFLECAVEILNPAPFLFRSKPEAPWDALLAPLLTPEQSAQIAQLESEITSETRQQLRELEGSARQNLTHFIQREFQTIPPQLQLPPERTEQLLALAREAESSLLPSLLEDLQRPLFLREIRDKANTTSAPKTEPDHPASPLLLGNTPKTLSAWNALLLKILSPAELRQVSTRRITLQLHTQTATSRVLISLLDSACKLSASQRSALEPLLLRTAVPSALAEAHDEKVVGVPRVIGAPEDPDDEFPGGSTLVKALSTVPQPQIARHLTPFQRTIWSQSFASEGSRPGPLPIGLEFLVVRDFAKSRSDLPAPNPETQVQPPHEQRESALSETLLAWTTAKRTSLRAQFLPVAHELLSLAQLPPQKASRILAAAHGSIETSLQTWTTAAETHLRERLKNTPPEQTAAFLRSIHEGAFPEPEDSSPLQSPLWQKTLASELSPNEWDRWKQAQSERSDFQRETLLFLTLRHLDFLSELAPAQIPPLRTALAETLQKYEPDFKALFGNFEALEGSFLLVLQMQPEAHALLWNLVPENELQKLLTPAQRKALVESPRFAETAEPADELRKAHLQRTAPPSNP
ncbi:MAG: hypothetical protein RLZZ142_2474 [Verrucomicrobiota bacterium]